MKHLSEEVIQLLRDLIRLESISRQEDKTATLIYDFLENKGTQPLRLLNNVWVKNKYFDPGKRCILLNSHHDTVSPNPGYTRNPFDPQVDKGILYGLGSNDAGASLISLLAAFLYFYEREDLEYNLVFAASAEEEISGSNGIEMVLPLLGPISFGIVGEPTGMHIAIAEKGLMVLDCEARGIAGHAARDEGDNAIYKAIKDIEWFKTYEFPRVSELLGPVKMSVTMIQAGVQHNVVPASCSFTVDIRITDSYTHEEILEIIKQHVSSVVTPRSARLKPSSISRNHPLVQAGLGMGRSLYGSATTSDQALMYFPTIKMGPGDSARSHSADEYVYLYEIQEGIHYYIKLLNQIL